MGTLLGLTWRIEPIQEWLGLPPWPELSTAAAAGRPFNGGSGFFVTAEGHFVSAEHVLGHCARPVVMTPEGLFVGRHVAADPAHDVAVIQVDWQPPDVAVLPGYEAPLPWEAVAAVRFLGCGGLASRSVLAANAATIRSEQGGRIALLGQQPIKGGNSGSPVVDGNGAVIGMIVARYQHDSRNGLAIDAAAIKTLLDRAGVAYETVPLRLPMSMATFSPKTIAFAYPVGCLL